ESASEERDLPSVGRPGDEVMRLRFRGQQSRPATGASDDVDLPDALPLAREGDPAPVRRPGKPADVGVGRQSALTAPAGVHDEQAPARACERQPPPIRRPGEVAQSASILYQLPTTATGGVDPVDSGQP